MNVTRDTIIDLLPLYLSGEASSATQHLVSEFLAKDPELGTLAREQRAALTNPLPSRATTPDLETRSFVRTRKRVVAQRWSFGLAWLFTAVALSTELQVENSRIVSARLALLRAPILLAVVATAAAGCWLAYFALRRRG
jgi:hypothetical protein